MIDAIFWEDSRMDYGDERNSSYSWNVVAGRAIPTGHRQTQHSRTERSGRLLHSRLNLSTMCSMQYWMETKEVRIIEEISVHKLSRHY